MTRKWEGVKGGFARSYPAKRDHLTREERDTSSPQRRDLMKEKKGVLSIERQRKKRLYLLLREGGRENSLRPPFCSREGGGGGGGGGGGEKKDSFTPLLARKKGKAQTIILALQLPEKE